MKFRQIRRGARNRPAHRRSKGPRGGGGRRAKDRPLTPGERQHLVQFLLCGGMFVLLVAVKLLLPDTLAKVDRRLCAALEQNMDVQSVFHAVGRAFSGEEDAETAAEAVYRAVFYPEEDAVEVSGPAPLEAELPSALSLLEGYRRREEAQEAEPSPPSEAETVLYCEENLPECVTLEQVILGFPYTAPLPGGTLSSGFGYRAHPTVGEERFHYGIDLAAAAGTAVCCFADGEVKAVGESSSYGNYCIVDHEGGFSTLYAHCRRILVSSGAEVTQGEHIAEVGETGMATGPHLHFELQREGIYLNPVYYAAGK